MATVKYLAGTPVVFLLILDQIPSNPGIGGVKN